MLSWSPGAPRSLSALGLVGTCFAVRADRPLPPFLPWGRGQDGLFGYLLGRLGGVEVKLGWFVQHERPEEHPIRLARRGAGDVTEAIALLASQCPPPRRTTLTELASWLAELARRGPTRLDALLREGWRRRWSHQRERLDALTAGAQRDLLLEALAAAESDPASHRPRELRVLTDAPGLFADVLARHARHCEAWAAVVAAKEALAGIGELVPRGRPWT